ncbi:MAG: response regulator [bacterium]|nr:response regulator [bacterium]
MSEQKKKILIVEDDKILSSTLVLNLIAAGFDTIEARDGKEGLEYALTKKSDLILLDIVMPGMGGITMLKQLRKDEWGKRANVIVLTNYDAPEKLADVLEEEVYDYMLKTTSLEEVIRRVKQKLGQGNSN